MFTKSAKIEVTRKAQPYTYHGITDPSYIVPQIIEIMTVKSARKTQNGLKVHFRRDDNTGYAIYVENNTLFSFKEVE